MNLAEPMGHGCDEMKSDKLIEVRLPGHTVFLKASEIHCLLRQDAGIWQEGIKRGKYILRARKQRQREQAK